MGPRPNEDDDDEGAPSGAQQRLDKWLWFVRVIKSRTQAAALVTEGKVRVNGARIAKPSHTLRPGDVVTVGIRGFVRVLKVIAPGVRRGPPAEAQTLYEEISTIPPAGRSQPGLRQAVRAPGDGRPTKRDRRQLDKLRDDGN